MTSKTPSTKSAKKLTLLTFSEDDWELLRKQIRTMVWGGITMTVSLGKTTDESAEDRSKQIIDLIRKYLPPHL